MTSYQPTDFDWHRWLNGDCPPFVQIGTLSYDCMNLIGAKSSAVWAGYPYFQKVRFKHRIEPQEAPFISEAIERGAIFRMPNQPQAVQFHVKTQTTERRYKLVLKVTDSGEQVWLRTFFRTDETTYLRARKRGIILKE